MTEKHTHHPTDGGPKMTHSHKDRGPDHRHRHKHMRHDGSVYYVYYRKSEDADTGS